MKRDVLIFIDGLSEIEGVGLEPVTLTTEGRFYKKSGRYYVSYDESEITGLSGTKTTLSIGDNSVNLVRTGTHPGHLVFEPGRTHLSYYYSEAGGMSVGVSTHSIDCRIDESGGSLHIRYGVNINSTHAGVNNLKVDFRSI